MTFNIPMDQLAKVPPECAWTPKLVAEELVGAVRLVMRVAGPVGPRGYRSNMPATLREWTNILGEREIVQPAEVDERNNYRVTPSAAQISRMERALHWQSKYLAAHPGPRRVLKIWLRSKAMRRKFGTVCSQIGWTRATAYRARDRALSVIAIGLMLDGVPMNIIHESRKRQTGRRKRRID